MSVGGLWSLLSASSWSWLGILAANALLAALLYGVALLLCRLLRRRGPRMHHALLLLVFIRLVLPPGLGHPLAVGDLAGLVLAKLPHGLHLHPAPGDREPEIGTGVSVSPPIRSQDRHSAPAWSPLLAAAWLAGFASVALLLTRRRALYRRLAHTAPPVDDDELLAVTEEWRQRLGIRRRVGLRTGPTPVSPFTVGLLRPLVFLPEQLVATADPDVVEAVVAHELAHVAHLDGLWLWLQHALQAVYFFNPAVWLAAARLDHERERLADAAVLAGPRLSARAYADSIVRVLELGLGRVEAPALSPRARRIHMRLVSILLHDRNHTHRASLVLETAAVLALGLFLLPMARSSAAPSAAPAAVQPAVEPQPVQAAARLTNPLPGARVTLPWGMARNPFDHEVRQHEGIDLAAASGTAIVAAADGVVEHAANGLAGDDHWGLVVVIDHGDELETMYAHLGEILVRPGQRVRQGEAIARVGSTGLSTGPHLHFAVLVAGEPRDPASWVADWDPR